jgi:hypothetical protein
LLLWGRIGLGGNRKEYLKTAADRFAQNPARANLFGKYFDDSTMKDWGDVGPSCKFAELESGLLTIAKKAGGETGTTLGELVKEIQKLDGVKKTEFWALFSSKFRGSAGRQFASSFLHRAG